MIKKRTIFLFICFFIIANLFGSDKNVYLSNGYLLLKNDKIESAEKSFQTYLKSLTDLKDKREVYIKIASEYNSKLYFDLSILYAIESIELDISNSYLLKKTYQIIAVNHLEMKNFDLAINFYNKSIEGIVEDSLSASDYNLYGEILREKGAFLKAIDIFRKAIVKNKINKNPSGDLILFNNIGLAFLASNNYDSSSYYLNKSLKLINSLNLFIRKSAMGISFGKLYQKSKKYKLAIENYKNIFEYDLSNHPDEIELKRDAYLGIWKCYELSGDYKNAFSAYKQYNIFNSKIHDNKKQANAFQYQIMSERVNHKKELEILNKQIVAEQKYKVAIILVSLAIFLIITLLLYTLWIRNKSIKQKIELAVNNSKIQELQLEKIKLSESQLQSEIIKKGQEEKIKVLETKDLEKQIDSKNRELTSTAIHLLSKNEILTEIKEKLQQLKLTKPEELNKSISRLNFLIKDNLVLDDDWEIFQKHFTDVHPTFFENLKRNYPSLTTDELKLCAYLKIQLSSKEIARLIYVSVAAVNKRRNRIRKKFDISSEIDLYEFLLELQD